MSGKETQRIRDPVHGLIVFGGGNDAHQNETDRIAWRLLNTREFQRLRRIRQLGFSDLVYPGATHSRLAHAIGVYHTARRLIEVIRRRQDKTHDDKERARVVLLATLLHDIGHGSFSHVFEHAPYASKRHEDWGAEIVQGETEVNHQVLREVDEVLPEHIGALLKEEIPKDFYATVVSSQFDADRLDYVQRDRLMTGVEFAHLDFDWLLDCLEVGTITIDQDEPVEVPCLYLNFKGVQVAEEYLQARFRFYTMVYMHKTTRAAEKMLDALLKTVTKDLRNCELARRDPILRYFTSESPSLGSYLDLDDAAVWATLAALAESPSHPLASDLARRLRERRLYKCFDIGIQDSSGGNLYNRFRRKLRESHTEKYNTLLFDDAKIALYKWYDFADSSVLNKVLVKTRAEDQEPRDIADVSSIVSALREEERIQRVYAPDQNQIEEVRQIMEEVR